MLEIEIAYHTCGWGADDLVAAIADISAVGFRGMETHSDVVSKFEDRPLVFNEMLAQHDIALVGITAGGQPLTGLDPDEEVERAVNYARFLKATGAKVLSLYAPARPASPEAADPVPKIMEAFNEIGKRTLDLGITTCLHPQTGTLCDTAKDIARFMEGTDHASLFLCPDLGHLAANSIAPERFIDAYASRIRHMHWKDYRPRKTSRKAADKRKSKTAKLRDARKPTHVFAELGKGVIKLQKVVDVLNKTGYSGWATIEMDDPVKSPKESAAVSYAYAERILDLVI